MDICICVATKEECSLDNCKRRHIKPNPYSQSYQNFSLEINKGKNDKCLAYKSWSKNYVYDINAIKD